MKTTVSETFLNKVAGCKPAALLKKKLRHRFSPVNLTQTHFLYNTYDWLLKAAVLEL